MEELRYRDSLDLLSQQQKIIFLEDKVAQLSKLERDQIPFVQVTEEAQVLFNRISQISYSKEVTTNFQKLDTLAVFTIKYHDSIATPQSILDDNLKLGNWLRERLELDTLVIKNR